MKNKPTDEGKKRFWCLCIRDNHTMLLGSEDIYDHPSLLKMVGSDREYMIDVVTDEIFSVKVVKI